MTSEGRQDPDDVQLKKDEVSTLWRLLYSEDLPRLRPSVAMGPSYFLNLSF